MRLRILRRHIKKARKAVGGNTSCCPVAQALSERFNKAASVYFSCSFVNGHTYKHDTATKAFINVYDTTPALCKPTTITLEER